MERVQGSNQDSSRQGSGAGARPHQGAGTGAADAFQRAIAHDLRAPLRAVTWFARLLDDESELSDEGRRFTEHIRTESEVLRRRVDAVLECLRIARVPLGWQTVDMDQLVREVVAFHEGSEKTPWRIGALPACVGDRALLGQLWSVLIENAVQSVAGRKDAELHIGFDAEPAPGSYFVRDNGVGLPPEQHERAFDPFFSLGGAEPRLGMGLAFARLIAERHNSTIWAASPPGEGAVLSFASPVPPRGNP